MSAGARTDRPHESSKSCSHLQQANPVRWTPLHSSPCIHFPGLLLLSPATEATEASWHRCACRRVARRVQRFCAFVIETWSHSEHSHPERTHVLCAFSKSKYVSQSMLGHFSNTPVAFLSSVFSSLSRSCCRGAAHRHASMFLTTGLSNCQCSEMRSVIELSLSHLTFALDFVLHLFSIHHFSSVSLSIAPHRNEASTPQATNKQDSRRKTETAHADTPMTDKQQQQRLSTRTTQHHTRQTPLLVLLPPPSPTNPAANMRAALTEHSPTATSTRSCTFTAPNQSCHSQKSFQNVGMTMLFIDSKSTQ